MRNVLPLHGRTHLPIGSDPLPGSGPIAAVLATRNAVQSIAVNTPTIISFDTVDYEQPEWIDLGIDDTLLTVPADGYYTAQAWFRWSTAVVGGTRRSVYISHNGAFNAGDDRTNIAASLTDITLAYTRKFFAGDTLRLSVLQISAGALDIIAYLAVTQVGKRFVF